MKSTNYLAGGIFSLVLLGVIAAPYFISGPTFAVEPPYEIGSMVYLTADPRSRTESMTKNWPDKKSFGLSATYLSDKNLPGTISFRAGRKYATVSQRETIVISVEGCVNAVKTGETFPLFNAVPRLFSATEEAGVSSSALLDILKDDYAQKCIDQLGKGFFLCENAVVCDGTIDGKGFLLLEVKTDDLNPKELIAAVKYLKGFEDSKMSNILRVGDIVELRYKKIRVTHIEMGDKQTKRRGWIVLEPVLPEPVLAIDE